MRIFLNDVRNERQLKSLIGLSREEFDKLLEVFSVCLEEIKNNKYRKNRKNRKRRPGGGRTGSLGTPENKLFFILYYLKNYPTFDVLGFIFDMNPSKSHENVKKLTPILRRAQRRLQILPKQHFKNADEFYQVVENTKNIAIDAT
ncbi:MAG: transposase family protein [Candidatus Competibacteraceae bacterium]